jgi:leucyl/phenylalanyl-tRNA--protein transferase
VNATRLKWLEPDDADIEFPDVSLALKEPNGLLAAGGDLRPERLLAAYRAGIFPWYEAGQPILWWSPDPRCILIPAELRIARRLLRQLRTTPLEVTFDNAFTDVIEACAGPRRSQQGTWITAEMATAYRRLYDMGWAHSVEVWDDRQLVGGVYGVCIGRAFFGESMFSGSPNTSKMALVALTRHMLAEGIEILDCQVSSPHLLSLGATLMPRAKFVSRLERICVVPAQPADWPRERRKIAELSGD